MPLKPVIKTMRILIPYIISACLTTAFSLSSSDAVYAQSDQEHSSDSTAGERDSYVRGLTPARAKSLVGGVLGLVSVIVGWRVKKRPGPGRSLAVIAFLSGIAAIVLSIIHLANTNGGFGTGGGKAGAIVALLLGLVGTGLSGLAMRSKVRG
jgi:hypothetical protein